eukprot:TRINITY_DN255_c0_g1_i1.p1 TRINITY_DN255_c0_g1~~TRINITY_DN255_c0_g1_i1.p1  ORF type:complete len:1315 (+),score=323.10 TRINITY_DN255_c0_g1_i1:52-3996(+)
MLPLARRCFALAVRAAAPTRQTLAPLISGHAVARPLGAARLAPLLAPAIRSFSTSALARKDESAAMITHLAGEGQVEALRKILQKGGSPNAVSHDNRSALHLACQNGRIETVRLLVEFGANPNVEDRWGITPLAESIRSRHTDISNFLRQNGALRGAIPPGQEGALFCQAAAAGDVAELRELYKLSGRVNHVDYDRRTPLHLTASEGHAEATLFLLENGADVNAVDRFGNTPLLDAVRSGKKHIVDILLNQGATSGSSGVKVPKPVVADPAVPQAHLDEVFQLLHDQAVFQHSTISQELDYYYNKLGLQPYYFKRFAPAEVAGHINSYIASKRTDPTAGIHLNIERDGKAFYLCPSNHKESIAVEQAVEAVTARWEKNGKKEAHSLTHFVSAGTAVPYGTSHLSMYIVDVQEYINKAPGPMETDLKVVSTQEFLQHSPMFLTYVQDAMNEAVLRNSPLIKVMPAYRDGTIPVMIAFRRNSVNTSLWRISEVLESTKLTCKRKLAQTFSNDITLYALFMNPRANEHIMSFVSQMALTFNVPPSHLTPLYVNGTLTAQEYAYASAVSKFVFYFSRQPNEDMQYLSQAVGKDPINAARLRNLRNKMKRDAISEARISQTIASFPEIIRECFVDFSASRMPWESFLLTAIDQSLTKSRKTAIDMFRSLDANGDGKISLAEMSAGINKLDLGLTQTQVQVIFKSLDKNGDNAIDVKEFVSRLENDRATEDWRKSLISPPVYNDQLATRIKKETYDDVDQTILLEFLTFNQSVLKTNFFKTPKAAMSFRFDTKFFARDDTFPVIPYGLFLVMSNDFTGFHVRFEDIARGGIRIIKSANTAAYERNAHSLFMENYNLAYTQTLKNKDIPEFGSKGTILLAKNAQENVTFAFRKYISGVLDLLLGHPQIVDHHGKTELLFMGPDENTADLMEWAANYSKARGYPFWKSFSTGKPPSMGGIPHDVYAMTTRSVHTYVLGTLAKLGLDESKISKVQTGGPDGDLGSNEILISKDKTIAVVDGSGVLYDPSGLNRPELVRLAKMKKMVKHFDTSLLSPEGYLVEVGDRDKVLPGGEVVESGMVFRNEFHLRENLVADIFVPCGGRPESINSRNVHRMFKEDGSPRFPIIVEGANLFISQEARLVLEKKGVVLFKDASANKGGVTSSSLEVLAGLSLSESEFLENMCVQNGVTPPFYTAYVKEVQRRVEENAHLEFECLWKEKQASGTPYHLLTDALSDKINTLNIAIGRSQLWSDSRLRTKVLSEAIPEMLIKQGKGLDTLLTRIPENYTKAIFSAYLASRYVYRYGLRADEFAFYEFMEGFMKQ